MSKDQETKTIMAERLLNLCGRFDEEAAAYEALRKREAALDAAGDMQGAKATRVREWRQFCTLALVAENILAQIKAFVTYFRAPITDLQTVCDWVAARGNGRSPDAKGYWDRCLMTYNGWRNELQRRTAWKSAQELRWRRVTAYT